MDLFEVRALRLVETDCEALMGRPREESSAYHTVSYWHSIFMPYLIYTQSLECVVFFFFNGCISLFERCQAKMFGNSMFLTLFNRYMKSVLHICFTETSELSCTSCIALSAPNTVPQES